MARVPRRAVVAAVAFLAVLAGAWWITHRAGAPEAGEPSTGSERGDAVPAAVPGLVPGRATGRVVPGAASAPSEHDAPAKSAGSLRGVVVDEKGQGIAGAGVFVRDEEESNPFLETEPAARTDAEGRFVFARAKATHVRATSPGHALVGSLAYVEPGVEARLVMVPACPLRVRVVEEGTGVAVTRAHVRAITGPWTNAVFTHELETPFAAEAWTDEQGRATLATEGGPANVLVVPSEHAPTQVPRVNVPPEGRDLEVRVGRGGVVEGTVVDPDGAPVVGAVVDVWARPAYRREALTREGGRFRCAGVPGPVPSPYEDPRPAGGAVAWAAEWAYGYARVVPPKAGETVTVEVRLRRLRTVRGRVLHADGRPAHGARVEVAEVSDDAPYFDGPTPHSATDAEGRFEVGRVPGGVPASVGVRWGDPSVDASQGVVVPEAVDPDPVEIRLPDRSGRTTVRVVDARGDAVPAARIEVKSGPPRIQTVATATTDAAGTAALAGLPSEHATLHVYPPASVPFAKELDVTALAGGEVKVVLDGAGTIAGVARRGDGTPAQVRLHLERQIGVCMEPGAACTTDAEGRFAFGHLPEGMFRIDVEGEGNVLLSVMPWVQTGERDVRVWVVGADETARYHFEVVLLEDATGKPVPPASAFQTEFVPSGGTPGSRFTWGISGGGSEPGRFVSPEPVPPGVYDVALTAQGWRKVRLPAVRIPRTGPPPVLRLDRGLRLEGRVVLSDGQGVSGVGVSVGGQGTKTGADGSFAIEGLEAGDLEARVSGDFVASEERTVSVTATGPRRLDWTVKPAGAIAVVLGVVSPESGIERVRATPLAGGEPEEQENDGPLTSNGNDHGTRLRGLAPGKWRVEAWQGTKAWPAQEVEVRAGALVVVRFPAAE